MEKGYFLIKLKKNILSLSDQKFETILFIYEIEIIN